MPIQNTGTLLENLVLVEAANLLNAVASPEGPLDFVNSFAMPPLSKWQPRAGLKQGLDDRTLDLLSISSESTQFTLRNLMGTALRNNRRLGPSGALLTGLLFRQKAREARMWLNDLEDAKGAHYQDTQRGLIDLRTLLDLLAPVSPQEQIELSFTPYPESLSILRATLKHWQSERPVAGRLGYLDPDSYRVGRREGSHTSSSDHQIWLEAIGEGIEKPVISVHFTGLHPFLNRRMPTIERLVKDGTDRQFDAISFVVDRFAVAVHVRGAGGPAAMLIDSLVEAVHAGWQNWFSWVNGHHQATPFLVIRKHLAAAA